MTAKRMAINDVSVSEHLTRPKGAYDTSVSEYLMRPKGVNYSC